MTGDFSASLHARDDAVVVTTLRNPVAKSYRGMVEGATLFPPEKLPPRAPRGVVNSHQSTA